LQKFYASVKDCSVTLKEYEAGELERQLNMERIDLVVDLPNPDTARYDSLPIAEVNILLAAPKSIGLSEDRSGEYPAVAMLDLPKLKFIALAENVCFTEILSDIFKRLHASPIIAMECQSPQIAHTMVSFDMGVTLLPEYCFVHNKLPNVVYYTIHGYPISHTVTVLHRKDRPLSEDADRFLSILKEEITGGTL
jgi:DNA-binding transcriptional LysR family regulator